LIIGYSGCVRTEAGAQAVPGAEVIFLDEFTDGKIIEQWLLRVTNEKKLPLLFYDGFFISGLS
jgi:hypothetical protein